ncbi:cell division suppressor protein YneA [Cohnella cholangitidis]|nr:LysM peptidoglycan-binding domain-containing protein [Cohnella cholangitidis]
MVHSWVTVGSANVSNIRKSAPYKSGRAVMQRTSAARNWKFARSVFFLFAFLILFSGFALFHTFASSEETTPATSEEIVISVDSGDTLWEIARDYKKDSMDTRQAVHHIVQRNGLSTSEVSVGQSLIIPARIIP